MTDYEKSVIAAKVLSQLDNAGLNRQLAQGVIRIIERTEGVACVDSRLDAVIKTLVYHTLQERNSSKRHAPIG